MSLAVPATAVPSNGNERYDPVARVFHWLVVVMLAGQYLVALVLASVLPASSEGALVEWHFSLGSSVLVVMLARLAWRLTHPPPLPPQDLPQGLRLLSRATHWAFYALFAVLPVLGWAAASAQGARVRLAGVIPLPLLMPKDDPFGKAMATVHPTLALTLLGLIALHVAGAMYHALIKHDGVLGRMLPRWQRR